MNVMYSSGVDGEDYRTIYGNLTDKEREAVRVGIMDMLKHYESLMDGHRGRHDEADFDLNKVSVLCMASTVLTFMHSANANSERIGLKFQTPSGGNTFHDLFMDLLSAPVSMHNAYDS